MDYSIFDCVDSGTENCPCYLAVTGDCLVCSRLQGKEFCDCRYRGVCIYNEFTQSGKKINNPRKDFVAKVVERKQYLDDLAVFVIEVGKGFALKASRPGSYVFLKTINDPDFYNVPISVMKSDIEKGQLHLAVKSISTKTKLLFKESGEIMVRGVYRNGILALKEIVGERGRIGKDEKILIITKGVGFAPAVLLSEWAGDRAQIDFLIDTDKLGSEIILDYMPSKLDGIIKKINLHESFQKEEGEGVAQIIKEGKYDAILALTSDFYIEKIREILSGLTPSLGLAYSNNFRICCGEGICGACSVVNTQGMTFKMCKCHAYEP